MKMNYGIVMALAILSVIVAGCATEPSGTIVSQNNQNGQDYSPQGQDTQTNTQADPSTQTVPTGQDNTNTQNTPAPDTTTPSGISSTELANHNSASDCWVAFQGKVYDVTAYSSKHPGGQEAITQWCGTSSEFEKAFTGKHGMSKVGVLTSQGVLKGNFV